MRTRILTPIATALLAISTIPAEASARPADSRQSPVCTKYVNLARQIGWSKQDRWTLRTLMHRESRCQPTSIGRNRNTLGEVTSTDMGLLQINSGWISYLRDLNIISNLEDLLDPRTNLKAGLALAEYSEAKGLPRFYQWRTNSENGSGQK